METRGDIPEMRYSPAQEYRLADIPPDPAYDEIAALAARLLAAPVSLITLQSGEQLCAHAMSGQLPGYPRLLEKYCRQAIEQASYLDVPAAALADQESGPAGSETIVSCACAPLLAREGHAVGALCVYDYHPREWSPLQRDDLLFLARQVMVHIEQAQADTALREVQYELQELQRVGKLGTWRLSLDTGELMWSAAVAEIFGVSIRASEPPHQEFRNRVHPRDLVRVLAAKEAAIREGSLDVEYRIIHTNGTVRWLHSRAELIQDRFDRNLWLTGTVQDVTEHRQFASDLNLLFKHSLDLICIAGGDGYFKRVSPSFQTVLGWSVKELLERPCLDLIHPEDRPEPKASLLCAEEGKDSFHFEARFQVVDGQYRQLSWVAVPLPERRLILGIGRDVTDQRRLEKQLETSVLHLQAILESMADMVMVFNRDWEYTYINAEAERVLRRSRQSLVGKVVWDECPELGASPHGHFLREAVKTGKPTTFEGFYEPLGAYMELRAFPFREGLTAYFRDTTESKRALEELRISNERFLHAANATNDALWEWDLESDELWWNEGFEHFSGYERSADRSALELRSMFIHPDDRERIMEKVRKVIEQGGTSWADEFRFLRKDGSTAYMMERGSIIRSDDGKAIRMIGGLQDLSGRHEREMRLRQQAALLDQARDAILVCEMNGKFTYWNQGASVIYGWTAEEALGRPGWELLQADQSAYEAATKHLLETGGWSGELVLTRKDGVPVVVDARWTLLRDTLGNSEAVLSIHTDITEKKKLEAQFLRAQRMESIGTLAGGIAHDLNNMLTPMLIGTTLLRSKISDPSLLSVIESMEVRAQKGAELIKQVLYFARGVEGQRTYVDIPDLLREMAGILRGTFPKTVSVEIEAGAELWGVYADPTQLHQVILNLCVNASDAMPGGGRLLLRAENRMLDEQYVAAHHQGQPGPYVVIEVMDEGIGIPPELHTKVFDPFFTTKEVGRGTGLGLSTVLAIVKSHHGFLTLSSEVGKGTGVRVYLPADPAAIKPDHGAFQESSLPRGKGETILVIDDEPEVREITGQMLEAYGYRVVTAQDGAEGIAIFASRRSQIAAVLTDMMMPVMDGQTTIFALKRIDPKVRIIAASGLSRHGGKNQLSATGAAYFLNKPYSAEKLLEAIRAVLT